MVRSVVKFHCKADILFPHARGLLLAGTNNVCLHKRKLSCRMLKKVAVRLLPPSLKNKSKRKWFDDSGMETFKIWLLLSWTKIQHKVHLKYEVSKTYQMENRKSVCHLGSTQCAITQWWDDNTHRQPSKIQQCQHSFMLVSTKWINCT